jgi:O-antigen/teichoic acid export membrane protein
MILSILIIFYSINLIIYSHALHYQQPLKIVKYNSLKFIFINAFGLLLLHLGLGYSDTVLERLVGLVIAEVLLCFITFYWLARHNWIWKIEINYLKNALKTSLPLIPGSIAALISAMSDRFFLGKHFDSGYVAEYNLALQILMPLQMVVAGAQTIWAPHIFAEKADDNAKIKSYKFFLQLLILFLLLIPALMLLTFMAKQYNVIPSTYNDTLLLIPSLSIGVICLVLLNIPLNLFIRSGKTSGIAYISIFGAVLTVIGCAFIIPRYGYFGGAVVNGVVNITMLAIAWWYVSKLNVRD